MKMPLRYNIINLLLKNLEGMTPKALHDILDPIYIGEKQCSIEAIDHHLMSMKGVGLVKIKDAVEDDNGNLDVTYVMTDYGATRAEKYIPEYLVMSVQV
ncbi:hypothetical protein GC105_07005 [Alkalibaculum sp. M08DMB]|uniref:DNA-binding protein n=1 Tax=Alkalibaculum sporogenes TaxID=2655001 RepID=A0A6A7K7Y9_9FIRM|nr:hypothetical protein [Alkalibaculum sporogenes]MPW25534.1 hypothetical protein [Alkalibaculum sporogenes]